MHQKVLRYCLYLYKEDSPKKQYLGELSTALNRIFAPYIYAYFPWWEEILRFGKIRIRHRLEFPAETTNAQILKIYYDWILKFIENSYVPGRNENGILALSQECLSDIAEKCNKPDEIFRNHPTYVNLTKTTTLEALAKATKALINAFYKNESAVVKQLKEFNRKLTEMDGIW